MRPKDEIVYLVEKALSYQFETFTWDDMIGCIDDLTDEEKGWAKEHTTYQVKEIGGNPLDTIIDNAFEDDT